MAKQKHKGKSTAGNDGKDASKRSYINMDDGNKKNLYYGLVAVCTLVLFLLVWAIGGGSPASPTNESAGSGSAQEGGQSGDSGSPGGNPSGASAFTAENAGEWYVGQPEIDRLVQEEDPDQVMRALFKDGQMIPGLASRMITTAAGKQSLPILGLLPKLFPKLDAAERESTRNSLKLLASRAAPATLAFLIQHPELVDREQVHSRIRYLINHDRNALKQFLIESSGKIPAETWGHMIDTSFYAVPSRELLVEQFEFHAGASKRAIAQEMLSKFLKSNKNFPANGFPYWWTLWEYATEDHKKTLQSQVLPYTQNFELIEFCLGLESTETPLKYHHIRDHSKKRPELFSKLVARAEPVEVRRLLSYEISERMPLEQLQSRWTNDLLQIAMQAEDPKSSHVSVLQEVLVRKKWPVAMWLIEQGADLSNLPNASPRQQALVAVVSGDQSRLSSSFDDAVDSYSYIRPGEVAISMNQYFNRASGYPDLHLLALNYYDESVCRFLVEKLPMRAPEEILKLATEQKRWDYIKLMAKNGVEAPASVIAKMLEQHPMQIEEVLASVPFEKGSWSHRLVYEIPQVLLKDVQESNSVGFDLHFRKFADFARLEARRNPMSPFSFEAFFRDIQGDSSDPITTSQLLVAAIDKPMVLEQLQAAGFSIRSKHLIAAIESENLKSVEICLRSIMMMQISASRWQQISELGREAKNKKIAELLSGIEF
ncbi:MAG: hypothetical protein AAF483_15750 [Planctomycetota bacterium]